MTDEEQRRQLLNQALLGLSPSMDAKTRARARLAALGPPAQLNVDSPSEDDGLAKGQGTGVVQLDRTRATLLLAAAVALGGLAGFALGSHPPQQQAVVESPHTPAQLSSTDAPAAVPRTSTLPLPYHGEPARLDTQAPSLTPPRTHEQRRTHATGDGGQSREGLRSPPKADDDTDEVSWIQRVRKALARGEPQVALGLLRELDVAIPVGRLAEERAAGRAIARCMLRPTDGAKEASGFTARYPNSVHLERVLQTCSPSPRSPTSRTSDSKP